MSTDVEQYLRRGLHRLAEDDAPTAFDVAALVDEGARRRRRRVAATTAGVTAAALVIGGVALGWPRPTTEAVAPGSGSSTWQVPAAVPGEAVRIELPEGTGSASGTFDPVDGLAYTTQVACRSRDAAARVGVDVRRDGEQLESSEVPCDGVPTRIWDGTYYPTEGSLTLTVTTTPADAQAYAVVVPDLDGPVVGEVARARVPWSGESATARLAVDVPMRLIVSCLAADPETRMAFRVVAGPTGEGRSMLMDTVRCDGSTSGDGFAYTATGERWATIQLDAPPRVTAFAVLTQATDPG